MNDFTDTNDLLNEIDPLLPDDAQIKSDAEVLVSFIGEQPSISPSRKNHRKIRTVLFGAFAVVGVSVGIAGAAGVFSADEVAVNEGIGCYETASLASDTVIFASQSNPVAACQRIWKKGVFESARSKATPNLVACTSTDGPVKVFPGGKDTCSQLDLEPLPIGYRNREKRAAAIQAVVSRMNLNQGEGSDTCDSPKVEKAKTKLALTRAGLASVPVVITGNAPCVRPAGFTMQDDASVAIASVGRDWSPYESGSERK